MDNNCEHMDRGPVYFVGLKIGIINQFYPLILVYIIITHKGFCFFLGNKILRFNQLIKKLEQMYFTEFEHQMTQ